MDHIQQTIAANLISIRKKRNLSLTQVSELTGVSKAMLAQIENGKSSPTVTTLWKIANGLQVSFSSFIQEQKAQVKKVQLKDLKPITDNEGSYVVYPFFPYHPEKKFEVYIVTLAPGCTHGAKSHLGEEYLLVKDGGLSVIIDGEEHVLTSGDALQFPGSSPHSYINRTEKEASFFLLMYYQEPQ
ncbi:helix-turn-helix domain-containing protein [Priestia flexa]|uniref:helix-turn-helix domain-containing protein n=1 Tax=Priestia TaxID=2800373 RepID=UPI002ED80F3B